MDRFDRFLEFLCGVMIFIVILLIIILISTAFFPIMNENVDTYIVTDKIPRQGADGHYLIFVTCIDGTTEVLEMRDSLFRGIFNTSDRYGDIYVGGAYIFETAGFRIPFFSEYKMITSYEEVPIDNEAQE